MSPVRTASRPRGHDNLSPGKSHRGRGKPAAGPRAPSPARRRSHAEPARAAVSLPRGSIPDWRIAEVIRLADLHDVHAGTLVPGCRQFQKSTPRPIPGPRTGAKIPGIHWPPQFCTSPPSLCINPAQRSRIGRMTSFSSGLKPTMHRVTPSSS